MKRILIAASLLVLTIVISAASSFAQEKKPNILVIMGDDIGWYNPSIYHRCEAAVRIAIPSVRSEEGAVREDVEAAGCPGSEVRKLKT
jgi:uncharacterized membrane protein